MAVKLEHHQQLAKVWAYYFWINVLVLTFPQRIYSIEEKKKTTLAYESGLLTANNVNVSICST